MLDVRRIRLLCDLARLGTIAAVAEARAYTPSAVSQQLTALEREAGMPLLERTGRRVILTPAGVILAQHGDTVLATLEQASAALAAAGAGLTGPLRIGAYPSAVRTLLPAALVSLGREHPGLELMVTELDPAAVADALRDRRLDIALTHDYDVAPAEPDRTLDGVPLLDETVYLAVPAKPGPTTFPDRPDLPDHDTSRKQSTDQDTPADHAATDTDPIHIARDAAWIVGSPGTLCHTVALRVCRAAGFTPRIRHHADDFATVLALVAAGQGVALVPQLATQPPPTGVRLIALPTRRRTSIHYRRGAASHPAVAACVAAVRAAACEFDVAPVVARHPARRPAAGAAPQT
jgi:DNA-binding transcriptional LysR family regulator